MKSQFKNYFAITKKQWNGLVVLVALILVVLAAPYVYQHYRKDTIINLSGFDAAVAQLNKAQKADSIAATKTPAYNNQSAKTYVSNKLKPGLTIELNAADSAKLTTVRGIGASFAIRIIRYRNRIGGFYKKEQLMEVYELDSTKYAEIKDQLTVDPSLVIKVNINTISFASLRQSPYLSYKQASAIIEYRTQHGSYNSIDDVGNVAIITPDVLHKIEPYIKFK
ncbi:ComEA family DNA-binding protein [Mucilaginibacter sp. E4BP6]|uniref:ComEA family DNA-binding protein n=1 Tax=Mucilaginibacter sp. E4BP6 TaxID=2723089 RepID=UPI0015C77025|nr:helix-hairpin-helix domain-containing protein [Mucilaginibacter sp. E4BP6]NYE67739.1 DNA uptake protein ComE-like DNA-binding protein [Mucilaginibacter sp. E4BP6]